MACQTCGECPPDRAHQNRRVFALLNELGIGDNERRELAMMLPTQTGATQPPSFAGLTGCELRQLCDWLTGGIRLMELAALRATEGVGD
jgi:hypothetical protein